VSGGGTARDPSVSEIADARQRKKIPALRPGESGGFVIG